MTTGTTDELMTFDKSEGGMQRSLAEHLQSDRSTVNRLWLIFRQANANFS